MRDWTPISGREHPRFSMIRTFFRLPIASPEDTFQLAIAGIPFDGGLSYRPGARFGPAAIRDISSLSRSYHPDHQINVFKKIACADIGDFTIDPLDLTKTFEKIEHQALDVLKKGKRLLSFGGDHSITLPLLRAYRKHLGTPVGLVHFDAHFDSYPSAWGHDYHHGSFLRHALTEGLIDPSRTVQIGIRGSLAGADDMDFINQYPIQTIFCREVKLEGLHSILKKIRPIKGPCYVTFDVDCLDPAFAPGTGTPVVGGLTSFEVQYLLSQGFPSAEVMGGDVVEVSPPYDVSQVTALVGAEMGFQILALMSRN